jgi:hypothetical protein
MALTVENVPAVEPADLLVDPVYKFSKVSM